MLHPAPAALRRRVPRSSNHLTPAGTPALTHKEPNTMLAVINDTGMVVVLAAVVLLFGASRLPNLARSLGEARKELKKANEEPAPTVASPAALSLPPGPADPSTQVVTLTRAELDALVASGGAASQAPTPGAG